MTKQPNRRTNRLFLWIGIFLLAAAVLLVAFWQWRMSRSAQLADSYVHTIRTLIPEPQSALPEERMDNTMPVLSLDDTDFVGILEVPQFGSALPVCGDWGDISQYPCRLSGSVYDRTIQIGGTAQKGQYDFYRELSVGDSVFFTDMEGNRYTYAVTGIRYSKHADQTTLQKEDAALTLFIQNPYAFEYIIIFCNTLG